MFQRNHNKSQKAQSGFTIVELIIVIVVIAILAVIIIVAFNGVRINAIDSRIKGDLAAAGSKLGALQATDDASLYASAFAATGITSSTDEGNTQFIYNVNVERTEYCLQAINSGRTWFITEDHTAPQAGTCDGTTGVPGTGTYTPDTDLSGSESHIVAHTDGSGTPQTFAIEIPEGIDYLNTNIGGGTRTGSYGANIRVKLGSTPTTGSNDCSDMSSTANYGTCFMNQPAAGTWYVQVFPYNASELYDNVTLNIEWGYYEGEYTEPLVLSAGQWSRKFYTVNVPTGTDYLHVNTHSGSWTGTGANIAVKYGSAPGVPTYAYGNLDCSSNGGTVTAESCFIYNPTPGTWYVSLYSTSAANLQGTYTNVNFTIDKGSFEGPYTEPLTLTGGLWSRKIYTVEVPAGKTSLTATLSGGTRVSYGANVAMKFGSPPGTQTNPSTNNDCNSFGSTNAETCTVSNPAAGTWYISVYSGAPSFASNTYSNVSFTVTQSP